MQRLTAALALCVALAAAGAVHAGPYADEFSKCVTAKTSDADNKALAVWLFVEISANPTLKPMANVTDAERVDATKTVAALVTRLVTDDCRAQAAAALRNEGGGVLMSSFWPMAQASIGSVARDPAVVANLQQLGQYLDTAKLASIMRDPPPAPK